MKSPFGAPPSNSPRASEKAGYSAFLYSYYAETTTKAQGGDSIVPWGELQHMVAELYISNPHQFSGSNSR